MSPQPLHHLFDDVQFDYSAKVLADRPVLASLTAQIIASWSVIEMHTGLIFASLVGENADTTMIVYDIS